MGFQIGIYGQCTDCSAYFKITKVVRDAEDIGTQIVRCPFRTCPGFVAYGDWE